MHWQCWNPPDLTKCFVVALFGCICHKWPDLLVPDLNPLNLGSLWTLLVSLKSYCSKHWHNLIAKSCCLLLSLGDICRPVFECMCVCLSDSICLSPSVHLSVCLFIWWPPSVHRSQIEHEMNKRKHVEQERDSYVSLNLCPRDFFYLIYYQYSEHNWAVLLVFYNYCS